VKAPLTGFITRSVQPVLPGEPQKLYPQFGREIPAVVMIFCQPQWEMNIPAKPAPTSLASVFFMSKYCRIANLCNFEPVAGIVRGVSAGSVGRYHMEQPDANSTGLRRMRLFLGVARN